MLPPPTDPRMIAPWPEGPRALRHQLLLHAAHRQMLAAWRRDLLRAGTPLRVEHPEFDPEWARP